ncbi:glucose-6-phosphate exchanger SLC37A2-like isoform X2 [Ostrea edulis]|uniref:glucose-6-phosphate exchanger SLC37A2-like isoform X2 n=1 Tax=Ostrea edulis TaxID=37623 RepID=UPI00209490B9|nr:glucose-6-phosphate exchanger SLC37A2-like isoform X2 [Ostrea edulis]
MTVTPPIGIRLLPSLSGPNSVRTFRYKVFILIFTFLCYTSYHLSRKPISVVKSVLNRNCSISVSDPDVLVNNTHGNDTKWCDWKPFDGSNAGSLLGSLDLAYLFSYAVGMFLSGHIAERMNLRYFLSLGMISSGVMTAAFGMGYFWDIHSIVFFIGVQIIGGLVQSTGWPSVVTCMGNWYGKGKRGFIMGIWNSHTSVGNILGSLIAGIFVNNAWGWSFIVPGIIITVLGILVFFFMVPSPDEVNCDLPDQTTNTRIQYSEDVNERSDLEDDPLLESLKSVQRISEYGTSNGQSQTSLVSMDKSKEKPISLLAAIFIPGVIEFSLCLFFAKLVSYTFLFWLPKYIHVKANYDPERAADISTLFDVGGIFGGIVAGLFSDFSGMRATTCVIMLVISAPILYIYNLYGSLSIGHSIGLSMLCGFFVNGPYALITTAVSADLGTHKILRGNAKALSTVTAIIDGTGSIGAAVGPLLAGVIESSGWNNVFYMLIASDVMALLFLLRLFYKEMVASFRRSPDVS